MKPVETTTPQLRSRSLSFRRRGPKGELARASKRDSKGGSSPNPIASPSPIPSGGGSGPEARAARSARWGGAGAASSPVGARGSIQSRLSRLSPLTSVSSKGCQGAADPQPRGSEWAGAKGWSRESHGKASASQKTDDDQPPPSTITRQPSLLPLLGPTLAALDQLPDEVLLQIMISVEGEAGRRANEEAVDTEGGIGLEHMPGDGLTAIVASVRREAARRLDLGPRL